MSLISNQDFNSDALYLVFHDAGTALGRLDLSDNAVKERFVDVLERQSDELGEFDRVLVYTALDRPLPSGKLPIWDEDSDNAGNDYNVTEIKAYLNPVQE